MNSTATLLALTDTPTTAQIEADLASSYLRWQYDDRTAALVTAYDRVAIVLYPAGVGEDEEADFEMADWYAERISKATYLETRTDEDARKAGNTYTVRPRCGACGYRGKWTQRLHAEDLLKAHTCDR